MRTLEGTLWAWALLAGCGDREVPAQPGGELVVEDPGWETDGDDAPVDTDGDGLADEEDCAPTDGAAPSTWYADADADGFGDPAVTALGCEAPAGFVADATDCDDADGAVHPGAVEVCDPADTDEDCSGAADDADPAATGLQTVYADADGDGYGDPGAPALWCDPPSGTTADATDCDDEAAHTWPGAPEQCDGAPNDCSTGEWAGESGRASVLDSGGAWTDVTATLAAGTPADPAALELVDETLFLCAGDWSAVVELSGHGGVEGRGGAEQVTLDAAGVGPVFTASGGDAVVRGLTLRGGDATTGGGVSATLASSLTIEDAVLLANQAGDGGGLYAASVDQVTLRRVTVQGNTATTGYGGGVLLLDCPDVALTDVEIRQNDNLSAFGGGGLCTYGATATTATRLTLTGNHASGYGGGWSVVDGYHSATDLVVRDNRVDSTGGGLDVSGDLTVTTGTISGNVANYGGGVRSHSGLLELEDVTLSANTSRVTGSALHVANDGDATLVDALVSDNTNSSTRAAINNNGRLELERATFSGTSGDAVRSTIRYDYDGQTVTVSCDRDGCE